MNIKRNQLAELIVTDGQPSRAIINYLQETMDLLENLSCVTDYYNPKETHKPTDGIPNIKITKSMFLDFVSIAHGQLREDNEKELLITDLYMNFNSEFSEENEYFNNDIDTPLVSFYLSTSKEEGWCYDFLIVFNNNTSPIIGGIEVIYSDDLNETFLGKDYFKYTRTTIGNEIISITINNTDESIDYIEEDIRYIIPLNKISF